MDMDKPCPKLIAIGVGHVNLAHLADGPEMRDAFITKLGFAFIPVYVDLNALPFGFRYIGDFVRIYLKRPICDESIDALA